MEDQGQFLNRFLSASAVLTAVLVGGYVILDQPFESARSPSDASTALFESRLWEDPLKAIYNIENRQEQAALTDGELPDFSGIMDLLTTSAEFRAQVSNNVGNNAVALGVVMPSGRYSLTSEIRRRIRYAVVSALNQSHLPLSGETLPVLSLTNSNLGLNVDPVPSFDQVMMSYEVYVPDEATSNGTSPTAGALKRGKVVVFWIPSQELGNTPIAQYAAILTALGLGDTRAVTPVLIGPDNSGALMNLFEELRLIMAEEDSSTGEVTDDQADQRQLDPMLLNALNALASRADSYLDNGLTQDKFQQLLDCPQWQGSDTLLDSGGVSECLESLNISDSDSNWYDTLADDYPQEAWMTAMQADSVSLSPAVQKQIVDLALEANWYLDDGLPANAFGELVQCFSSVTSLTQQRVRNCLRDLGIADSDRTWFDTLAEDYPQLAIIQAMQAANATPQDSVWQIILAAHEYLDDGMPVRAVTPSVICLQQALGAGLAADEISRCLNQSNITDSDRTWYDTVATNWVQESSGTANQFVPSVSIPDNGVAVLREAELAQIKRDLLILSPRATIPDTDIERRLAIGEDESPKFVQLRNRIIRTTNTDDRLLEAIYDELIARGIRRSDRVALVFESDSDYGRALRNYLVCSSPDDERCFQNVQSFSYLRGIDGQLPGESASSNGQSSRSENQGSGSSSAFNNLQVDLEAPTGRQQMDYLRRIAHEVNQSDFDVIGILGTDIFDKLLVLQALGDLNPDAVFFTTDLYSYLAHDSQLEWSRNLLIASAYSLNGFDNRGNMCLDRLPSVRGAVTNTGNKFAAPPFRDNYQSAYFYSTCYALRSGLLASFDGEDPLKNFYKSQRYLYEVGGSGPVQLQLASPGLITLQQFNGLGGSNVFLQLLVLCILISPLLIVRVLTYRELARIKNKSRESFEFYYAVYCAALSLMGSLFASCFLFAFWQLDNSVFRLITLFASFTAVFAGLVAAYAKVQEIRRSQPGEKSLRVFWLDRTNALLNCKLVCQFFLILIVGLLFTEVVIAGGEPLSLLDGISSWPAVLVRLQVLALSLCFCFYAYAKWEESNYESERALLGNSPQSRRDKFLDRKLGDYLAYARRRVFKEWSKITQLDSWDETGEDNVPGQEESLWRITQWVNQIDADTISRQKQVCTVNLSDRQPMKKSVRRIWREYRELGNWRSRLKRALPITLALTLIVFLTYRYLTPTPALQRDSFWIADVLFSDSFVLLTAFVAIFMIILGNDVTRLGAAFIRALRQYDLSDQHFDRAILGLKDYHNDDVNRKIFILEAIARRTRAITPLVLFPFMIVFLMIIARSSIFEGWRWDFELIVVYAGISLYILYGAYLLQREALLSRRKVQDFLESTDLKLAYWHDKRKVREEQELIRNSALKHVSDLNEGAFVVWYKHPIFQSIAFPTSGTSGLLLLQQLT